MTFSYPRLTVDAQLVELERIRECSLVELLESAATSDLRSAPVAVGYPPAPEDRIRHLASQVRALAEEHGYPTARRNLSAYDRELGRLLVQGLEISDHDASAVEVWGFLTIVVLPDVAVWRFPDPPDERLLGVHRNAFRRVWVRQRVLGGINDDDDRGTEPLGEDELVAIFERSYLSRNHELARSIARSVRETGGDYGVARSDLARKLTMAVRRVQPVLCMDALAAQDLDQIVLGLMPAAAEAVREEQRNRRQ